MSAVSGQEPHDIHTTMLKIPHADTTYLWHMETLQMVGGFSLLVIYLGIITGSLAAAVSVTRSCNYSNPAKTVWILGIVAAPILAPTVWYIMGRHCECHSLTESFARKSQNFYADASAAER